MLREVEKETMVKSIVAIIGRQNVGKSTLLNRVLGQRIAITEDMPGTTRDRIVSTVTWQGTEFTLVDTGGLKANPESNIAQGVQEQVELAIIEADVILFLVSTTDGITPYDQEIANILRRTTKPILLAANKSDNARREADTIEFYQLGLGDPLPVSAHHARGIDELLDKIVSLLPSYPTGEAETNTIKVAIVGRPNVGKSMLLNAFLGEERSIVDDTPGTTRDAIDTLLDFQKQSVLLIDTAGIRRRGRLEGKVERYSVLRALRAIDRADVALLVIDATEPFMAQDLHIAGYIQQAVKGIVLVVNKWDLAENKNLTDWREYIGSRLRFMSYAPVVYTSAKLVQGIDKVMPQVFQVHQERRKRLPTALINSIIKQAITDHGPSQSGRKHLKILYVTQAEVSPPTFVFFVNDAKLVHFSYKRYLENKLRQSFGFIGTPLKLIFKSRGEE